MITYPVSYTENNWMDSSFFARNFTLTDFNNLVLSGEIQIFCKRGEYHLIPLWHMERSVGCFI